MRIRELLDKAVSRCRVAGAAALGGAAPRRRPAVRFRPADSPLQRRPRKVHASDLLVEPRGPGVLQPGLSVDVRLRQGGGRSIVSRGAEARSELRDLLLGRSVGLGALRQRPDERGTTRGAPMRPFRKRLSLADRSQPEREGVDRGHGVHGTSSVSIRRRASPIRIVPTPRPWPRGRGAS